VGSGVGASPRPVTPSPPLLFTPSRRRQFAASIGVTLNETYSDSSVAVATVRPNWRKNWPMTPPMKAIGTKTTTSTNVLAASASPISARPSNAASFGGLPIPR
jgi:hypothetical protein